MISTLAAEMAAIAARLVVQEGLDYEAAKRKAARALGKHDTHALQWPSDDAVEDEVRTYLALFRADSQPAELAALRTLAAQWMQRLAEFRPYLTGSVWRGTATRLSPIHLALYCDDCKAAEIALLNQRIDYQVGSHCGPRGEPVEQLSVLSPCAALGAPVPVVLSLHDHDDVRGALRAKAQGRPDRGDLTALKKLMEAT